MKKRNMKILLICVSVILVSSTFAIQYVIYETYSVLDKVGNYNDKSRLMVEIIKGNRTYIPDDKLIKIAYLMGEEDTAYRSMSSYILEKNIDRWNVYADALVNMLKYNNNILNSKIINIFKKAGPEAKVYIIKRLSEEKAKQPGDDKLKKTLEVLADKM